MDSFGPIDPGAFRSAWTDGSGFGSHDCKVLNGQYLVERGTPQFHLNRYQALIQGALELREVEQVELSYHAIEGSVIQLGATLHREQVWHLDGEGSPNGLANLNFPLTDSEKGTLRNDFHTGMGIDLGSDFFPHKQEHLAAWMRSSQRRCHTFCVLREIAPLFLMMCVLLTAGKKIRLSRGVIGTIICGGMMVWAHQQHKQYACQAGFYWAVSLGSLRRDEESGELVGEAVHADLCDPSDPWAQAYGELFRSGNSAEASYPQSASEAQTDPRWRRG